MNNLQRKDTFTSLELVEQINHFRNLEGSRSKLGHNDLLKVIRDEFEEEIHEGKISHMLYDVKIGNGAKRKSPMFVLTTSQAKQVLVRESKFVRRAVIKYIEQLENQLSEQKNTEDVLTSLKRLTYKGQPVITLLLLERLVDINHTTLLYDLKRHIISYTHLHGRALREFKRENGYMDSSSSLVILNKEQAFKLMSVGARDEDIKVALLNGYFEDMLADKEECSNLLDVIGTLCLSRALSYIPDRDIKRFGSRALAKVLLGMNLWHLPVNDECNIHTPEGWQKGAIPQNSWSLLRLGRCVNQVELDKWTQELLSM